MLYNKLVWKVKLYITKKGENPVGDFIRSRPKKEEAKILREIDLLEQNGIYLNFPHASNIIGCDKLKELRIKFSSNNIRIIYFLYLKNNFILLHGFLKKTKKIPQKEFDIAKRRMEDYLDRNGG